MIGFLIKGLLRDRSRSLFPFLTVVAGVMMTVLLQTYMAGLTANMSRSAASFSTGHLKVMSRAYAKESNQAPNDLAYVGVEKLLGELRRQYPSLTWTPRISFGGLLDIPDDRRETRAQAPVAGLGIELVSRDSPERNILNLESAIVTGRMPDRDSEILVSDELARQLNIGPGSVSTLISSTMYGGMATSNFTIAGTVRFGIKAMDRGTIIADIHGIQQALDMEDAAGEIFGFFPNLLYQADAADSIAAPFNARWETVQDEFAPVMSTMRSDRSVAELLDYYGSVSSIVVVIFTLVMSIVLWNAGLIGSLRRYGEIGLRLAYGEDKGHLYRAMLIESLIIGFLGSVAGTLVAMVPSYWLQSRGFDASYLMPNSSLMLNSVIRAQITTTSFFIGFVPGLMATLIGTAISGIGIFKRQTATLMKEMEA